MAVSVLPVDGPVRPSSAAQDRTADDVPCAHCTLPVPAALVVASAEQHFCCAGCETAFAILHAGGLTAYYGFTDRRDVAVHASGRTYEEFDHPAFADLYVRTQPDGRTRTELYLEGVHCASCVWLVERVPLLSAGVVRAELDVRRSLAMVEWDPAAIPLSAIARTLDTLGYPPHPFRGVARADIRRREDRVMLVRIGIAGAIAINMMLAALALYAGDVNGMEARFTAFFRWISLGLTIPAFVWPGRVFFMGAWASLRTRVLHMDLPIAVALAAGFARGTLNTVRGEGPIYFDGLALLIFALLVGRYLQQRGQRLATDAAELLHAVAPSTARVVDAQGIREIPTSALTPGMRVEVRAGETIPADGLVVEGRSQVNAALLTGESQPATVSRGSAVYAGTLNLAAPLRVRVEEAGESSRIARLMQQVESSAARRAPVVQLANRLAGYFTAAVLLLSVITFVVRTKLGAPAALDDAIALLIVTCPCALALATPLAITAAVGRAARRGLLIKGGDALERLARPGTLLLDKTGTVTEGRVALVTWHGPDWVQPLVLALEAGSSHPVADGFRRAWPALRFPTVTDSRHVMGGGIEGTVDGHSVRIGSPRFVSEALSCVHPLVEGVALDPVLTPVHVAVDGTLVAVAGLGDRIRADAVEALTALRARGWRTELLSGDAPAAVAVVRSALDFPVDAAIGGATPEEKLARVAARISGRTSPDQAVVMVGDGVNDAAAIAAADVGIGVHGGAEACLATADIYLTRPGLTPLVELVTGAERTMRVIKRNLAISIGYNLIGATLAVTGVITPLIAAVLMPIASITVVLGSWYGTTFSTAPVEDPA